MATEIFGRHIIPVGSKPLKNGFISISEGKIERIAAAKGHVPSHAESCQRIIIPGLVNAHTHLDLTDMAGVIGRGKPFVGWIKEVIAWREQQDVNDVIRSINNGINLSLKNGTTCFGDYSSSGASFLPLGDAGLKGRVFLETVGFKGDLADERISILKTLLCSKKKINRPLPGIAPHAPYSVSRGLITACSELARSEGIPLSMHAGEVAEEIEFLYGEEGDMATLLKSLNAWDPLFQNPSKGAIEYLYDIGVLEGMVLVHLNFIMPSEFDLLRKSNCSAIFCPGSHTWFNRKTPAPIMDLVSAGINVALGSDGLSSNDSLSMFREMRLMSRIFPDLPQSNILEMATINGAKALSLDHNTGSLEIGKDADLVGIDCPEPLSDPLELLFNDRLSVKFVMVKGEILHGSLE